MLSSVALNIDASINSGQVFLWEKNNDTWYGINGKDVLVINEKTIQIKSSGKTLDFF